MGLTLREEIERELVRYDKQKLITECLKMFDSNMGLADQVKTLRDKLGEAQIAEGTARKAEKRYDEMTVWQFINQKLSRAVERKKTNNAKYGK